MGDFGKAALTVFSAIITLAIISVIVSRNSDSAGLVQGLFSGLSNVVKAAVTPLPQASTNGANVANVGGIPSLVDLQSFVHGDIDQRIAPLF